MERNFIVKDYTEKYKYIMQFGKNKNKYIHGWYPFVEGYSKEFINNIIDEYNEMYGEYPHTCLEPFSGSGTTPLELQKKGIKCFSFEVSPFMYNLSRAKLDTRYTICEYINNLNLIKNNIEINNTYDTGTLFSEFKTLVEKDGLKKWNFNKEIMYGILDIRNAINTINDQKYLNLFTIGLASILLEVSNVYRNGKCISYKKNWENTIKYRREDIHKIYFKRLEETFYPDIVKMSVHKKSNELLSNIDFCMHGDCRQLIQNQIEDNSIDLIITSPPYLNSRDYTDTYMVELKVLEYLKTNEDVRNLRRKTIRSHVQISWKDTKILEIPLLINTLNKINKNKEKFWNDSLSEMIEGYFEDMNILFSQLYKKMANNGVIFLNVANSAYYNVEIKVDEIICQIAENNGFKVKEIREARKIRPSSQQKEFIDYLRESVILITK